MKPDVYYFGSLQNAGYGPGAGHFLYGSRDVGSLFSAERDDLIGYDVRRHHHRIPWTLFDLDGRLALRPNVVAAVDEIGRTWHVDPKRQPENGIVCLHHREGWTAISFWDRTGDHRGQSCSTLVAEGIHDVAAMLALFAERFPRIWARIAGKLTLREHPANPKPAAEATVDKVLGVEITDEILAALRGPAPALAPETGWFDPRGGEAIEAPVVAKHPCFLLTGCMADPKDR